MRCIDLIDNKLGSFYLIIEGNNFGDQIVSISCPVVVEGNQRQLGLTYNHEGNHDSIKRLKEKAMDKLKQLGVEV